MAESVESRLARIETKVDLLLPIVDRVNKLERFEARVAGIAAAVSLVVGFVVKLWH